MDMEDSDGRYIIQYHFTFEDGTEFEYPIELDPNSLNLVMPSSSIYPEWTKLDFHQCEKCPLSTDDHSHCPIASGLFGVLEGFKDSLSHTNTKVSVKTPERTYSKETSLQVGIYSIMGLIMATSGCPQMEPLKPMARFHLPFSSVDETMIRSLGFFLIRQILKNTSDEKESIELSKFNEMYEEINYVNHGILARIRHISKKDANANGLIILDAFANILVSGGDNNFGQIRKFFFTDSNS